MLTRCIFCHQAFPPNQQLEHLPLGERAAFDPQRGRLWCICSRCHGWTLQPFEQRWEALEELERSITDRAKMLVQGENIALFRAGGLELLRIGRAGLPEEAWWRYGDELARRRQRAGRIARRGKIIDALVCFVILGVPIWAGSDSRTWIEGARRKAFGRLAWQGLGHCERCAGEVRSLSFDQLGRVQVLGELNAVSLRLPCSCAQNAGALLDGLAAIHVLRRLLAYHNFAGAGQPDVQSAASLVEQDAGAAPLLDRLFGRQRTLGGLAPVGALTLEIALNQDIERAMLQLELAELEAHWRVAEAIAAIVDHELT